MTFNTCMARRLQGADLFTKFDTNKCSGSRGHQSSRAPVNPKSGVWIALFIFSLLLVLAEAKPSPIGVTCSQPPIIKNAEIPENDQRLSYYPADVVRYICIEGYDYVDDTTDRIKCKKDGTWSAELPACAILAEAKRSPIGVTCSQPPIIKNAEIPENDQRSSYYPADVVRYMCIEGYDYVDDTTDRIKCKKDGTWSAELPACAILAEAKPSPIGVTCSQPPIIKNAEIPENDQRPSYNSTNVVRYMCIEGYDYVDDTTDRIKCKEDGTWSAELPACARIWTFGLGDYRCIDEPNCTKLELVRYGRVDSKGSDDESGQDCSAKSDVTASYYTRYVISVVCNACLAGCLAVMIIIATWTRFKATKQEKPLKDKDTGEDPENSTDDICGPGVIIDVHEKPMTEETHDESCYNSVSNAPTIDLDQFSSRSKDSGNQSAGDKDPEDQPAGESFPENETVLKKIDLPQPVLTFNK